MYGLSNSENILTSYDFQRWKVKVNPENSDSNFELTSKDHWSKSNPENFEVKQLEL